MTPEQDPAICRALDTAVHGIAEASLDAVPTPWTDYAADRDIGHVSPRIMARFAALVKNYNFTMSRANLDNESQHLHGKVLGATAGSAWPATVRSTVRIRRGMSAASEARVAAHECAHVILGHAGLTIQASIEALKRLQTMPEDPAKEAAAELAAGAFCEVAHIGTGRYSPHFIWQRFHGEPVPAEAIHAGLLGARILWTAAAPAVRKDAA